MKIKKSIFIIIIQVFALSNIFAQVTDTIIYENIIYEEPFEYDENGNKIIFHEESNFDTDIEKNDSNKIYIYVKQMPEFPGGIPALRKWITEHVEYPTVAKCYIQGTVYLRFAVKKTGEIGKIEIQHGVDPLLDKEAIRVIKSLPKFKPGMQNGKPVNVWFSVPVRFQLE